MRRRVSWRRARRFARGGLLAAAVAAVMAVALFPFYYAILTSLKTGTALFEVDYVPKSFAWDNYRNVLETGSFVANIANSLTVAAAVTAVSLALSLTAAYALSRTRFRGREWILLSILAVSMFPPVAVLSGLFEMVRAMGIYNSPLALVFSYMIFTLPFTVWVLTSFMRGLPVELEEAAIVDGAGPGTVLFRIFLPLLWPALASTGLLAFIAAWNEFLFALTFVLNDENRTVPVGIALLSGTSQHETPWGNIMAASVIVTLPLVLLALIFQRKIVAGLTAGAVKG